MKKTVNLLFFLLPFLSFSQNFKDTIITTGNGFVSCNINSIDNRQVLYVTKSNNTFYHQSISLSYVKKIIIDNKNNPPILLKRETDTLIFYSGYGNLAKCKKLILEENNLDKSQDTTKQVVFNRGQTIKVRSENNISVKGRIEYISDSIIVINKTPIKIIEIKSIIKGSGAGLFVTGLLVDVATFIPSISYFALSNSYYKYQNPVPYFLIGLGILDFIITVPTGAILMVNTNYYEIGYNWKIKTSN